MLKRALAVAGFVAAAATPASAQLFSSCFTNGSLAACASANLEFVSGSTYRVTLTHLGGGLNFSLTGFGFYTSPDVGKLFTLGAPIPANWSDSPPTGTTSGGPGSRLLNVSGVPANSYYFLHADCAGNPGDCGLVNEGDDLAFLFTLNGAIPSDYDFGWRAQSAGIEDDEGSIKCFPGHTDSKFGEGVFSCEPPTVVPEPATMALLATGLVGMGGATLLRRRRQKQDA